jgi:DNA-binding winged helix-turn-helix (wHTH) protein/Tol biopolymer transport system component
MDTRPAAQLRRVVVVATVNTEAGSRPREAAGDVLALRFGVFEMDLRSGELRKSGVLIRIQPQPFKVLALLVGHPGEVVTREEIQAEVWPAGTFVDFEQSLNFCVRQIRSALGDSALAPRFVETLPRRGYRWVGGPVDRVATPATVYDWPRPHAVEPGTTSEEPGAHPRVAGNGQRAGSHWPIVASAAMALAAVLLGGWLATRPSRHQDPPVFQRLTFRRGTITSARFAPDGQVVYAASWEGRPSVIQVARASSGEFRALDIADSMVTAVSPSGEVAFLRDGLLARAPLAGGPPKDVLKGIVAADWDGDASAFAVARRHEGRLQIEYPVGHVLGQASAVSRLRLSPDGRLVAFAEHPTLGDDRGSIVVLDQAGRRVASSENWSSVDGLAWSPREDEVWFTAARVGSENALHALSLDGRVRTLLSAMGRLVLHDVARDGRVLLERATRRAEVLYRREGQPEDRELSWLDFSTVEGLSADGNTLLLLESGEGGGPDYTTYLRRADGSIPVRLGPGRATDLSPDGQWVLSVPLRQPDHVDVLPTGPGEARQIRIPGVAAHEAAGWVGDGRTVFVTTRDAVGRRATWLVDTSGANPRRLPLPEGAYLRLNTFSPDGQRFLANCPDSYVPCFYPTAGGKPQPVPGVQKGWRAVAWDARGRIYLRDTSVPATLERLDPATGRVQRVAELAPRDRAGVMETIRVVVARSGEAWAYTYIRHLSDLYVVTGVR